MPNPILLAAKAKGARSFLRRVGMIGHRYGSTPQKMQSAISQFSDILRQYGGSATFPTTAIAIARNPNVLRKYAGDDIEFAVHGYTHVDYSKLASDMQITHLKRAIEVFKNASIETVGFRSPYLRRETNLYSALQQVGFSYVSNQPVMWNVLDDEDFSASGRVAYQHALAFYEPWDATERLSLPQLHNNLVEIPVSLPDDEILLDRLQGETRGLVARAWLHILSKTYQRGELFTVQLHPERTALAATGLVALLQEARNLQPRVWIARLEQIAQWWRARIAAKMDIVEVAPNQWRFTVSGLVEPTLLARGGVVDTSTTPWGNDYHQVMSTEFTFRSALRPFIGVSSRTVPTLLAFLQRQGYGVESNDDTSCYSYYLDRDTFSVEDELKLVTEIESSAVPLVRLGLWPNGARCALSITGDIDAFTLWDYGLRFLGA